MKLLILGCHPELPSTRYRATQLMGPLKQNGINVQFETIPSSTSNRLKLFKKCSDFDVVLLQKKLFQPWEFYFLRKMCKHLVFDLDDSIMFRQNKDNCRSFWRNFKFKNTIKNSDVIIAGNDFLAYRCLEYNPYVETIPTVIDLDRYEPKRWEKNDSVFTVGWIGTGVNLHYLESLRPVFEKIGKKLKDIELKIICDEFLDFENLTVEKVSWDYKTEIEQLQSFDVSLMPLDRDVWSLGKCGFKLIQSMAVGVPVICTPVGMNREIVTDGLSGYWAEDMQEWENKIKTSYNSRAQLKKMGKRARAKVENNYSISSVISKYISVFKRLEF